MLLGDPRQSDQLTQSFHFPIVIHQSQSRALKRQAPCLYMHFEVRALDRLRARRRVGPTRRRGNHMHDHSRFQHDINDVTGVSLSFSLLLLLTKVTDAQYRKRFRASYNDTDLTHEFHGITKSLLPSYSTKKIRKKSAEKSHKPKSTSTRTKTNTLKT